MSQPNWPINDSAAGLRSKMAARHAGRSARAWLMTCAAVALGLGTGAVPAQDKLSAKSFTADFSAMATLKDDGRQGQGQDRRPAARDHHLGALHLV